MITKKAFSLVELSIVLVILGLLTGGILTGQSLIRAAELRSITAQLDGFRTAHYMFRDKYFAIAGDITNATDFWGAMTTCPADYDSPSQNGETCNGNGDGNITTGQIDSVATMYEMHTYWQHLANAGLIEGSYTGVTGSSSSAQAVMPGENAPRLKISNGKVMARYNAGSGHAMAKKNYFLVGLHSGAASWPSKEFLTPEEAWGIDKKLDDGLPISGKIMAEQDLTTAPDCTDASVNVYKLSGEDPGCRLYFLLD